MNFYCSNSNEMKKQKTKLSAFISASRFLHITPAGIRKVASRLGLSPTHLSILIDAKKKGGFDVN